MADAKPKTVRTRAVELGRKMGARAVAEALAREGHRVGKSAVAEWLRADKARRAGAAGAAADAAGGTKKARDAKPEASPALLAAPASNAVGAELDLEHIDLEGLDFEALVALDKEVAEFRLEAYRERDERRYAVLARLMLDIRQVLEKLRPRPKVDPAQDPASLEARREVLARLGKMVDNAKQAAAARAAGG